MYFVTCKTLASYAQRIRLGRDHTSFLDDRPIGLDHVFLQQIGAK